MLTWLSVDAKTGVVLADLPDLECASVASVIGAYSTTTASLPVVSAPEGWERATLHGAACLVLVDDPQDGTQSVPLGGGMITRRERTTETVDLSLATWEAYLARRYVGDVTYTGVGQNAIVADLVDRFVQDGSVPLIVEGGVGGTVRDRTYKAVDDKRVLTVLSELSGVDGGPEWTISWRWLHNPERLVPVLTIATRLGSSPIAGLGPAAVFDMPGCLTDVKLSEDFGESSGATTVMAVSTPQGDVRPQSTPHVASDMERPVYEYRFTPSSSITQTATLDAHAAAAVALMADGSRTMSLVADWESAPRLGSDWWIGDDIGYDVAAPAFPNGLKGTTRALGWTLDLNEPKTITPIIAMED